MTKMEMINRMIILGCIKEVDRNRWLEKDKADVMRIYILIVPRRLKKLGRAQIWQRKRKHKQSEQLAVLRF